MGMLNPDILLTPITPDAPSGEDLAYDASFLQLEELFKGVPEKQVGDTVVPAQQPGLADGLGLLRGVLESQWGTLFPRLDPDDNNDPLERMNIIASLGAPAGNYGDPFRFIERVRATPLASSRRLGRFGLRDILIAKGEAPAAPDTKPPEMSTIEGAFADTPPADLEAQLAAARRSLEHAQRVDAYLDERVGVGKAPDLKAFVGVMRDAVKTLEGALGKRVDAPAEAGEGAPASAAPAAGQPGDIASPRDVVLALDRICRYYERSEVSSPVPFILKAARRMVSKNFVDIARIMTPEAIRTVEEMGREEGAAG